jgi:hypothetical protein
MIDDLRAEFAEHGVVAAIEQHDTATLFNWLAEAVSYQGVSDRIAWAYMERHGRATWADIQGNLGRGPSCPKLASYWQFFDCRYHKGSGTCAEPDHLPDCPLPNHRLRNGRLNQTAYSLFLFIGDIADGDLVAWLDNRLRNAEQPTGLRRLREAVLEPLRNVYGVSDKIWSMILSGLLLGAGKGRPGWTEVGGSMIAVDTLVHNFLHRTGTLDRLSADHPYGPSCYSPNGCAAVLKAVSQRIDARTFNPEFPAIFPRFVQHAIWRYCAQAGLNGCQQNR